MDRGITCAFSVVIWIYFLFGFTYKYWSLGCVANGKLSLVLEVEDGEGRGTGKRLGRYKYNNINTISHDYHVHRLAWLVMM